ncbi:hypothetical protein CAPTEDRAFT_148559 [Capitella teleta]|uniref:Probable RNA-binding protein 18 n=1 Tax=Capitella teleta TaxID=283909 RepID=R7V813_CAPTE|nr:hypothetical protein CAPTEDRAFT_148559 [Capitella teleta]|eukprot:ELU15003.1 hypothetical protein CAPTEDRAFT_148559 [Capitella teleta]
MSDELEDLQKLLKLPPPPELEDQEPDENRIWIGNIDSRINEFTMLKLIQKHGNLKHFDFLYHRSGPDQGKPRGYCFATYENKEDAMKAIKGIHGKMALSKKLVAKQAKPQVDDINNDAKNERTMSPASTSTMIKAIEEKLQKLKRGESDVPPGAIAPQLAHSYGSAPTTSVLPHRDHHNRRQQRFAPNKPKFSRR